MAVVAVVAAVAAVDEEVLGLEISVEDSVLVAERSALQELVHEAPNRDGIESATLAMDVHVLLEVALAVLEDEHELRLGMDDIV